MNNSFIKIKVKAVMPTSNGCAVFLGNDTRTFVIYVNKAIGETLQQAISGVEYERPQTHNLMSTILNGLGAEVEQVTINDVVESTFFARLVISMENELGRKIVEIDARPSDALSLALISQKPIYVCDNVLKEVDDMTLILEKILNQKDDNQPEKNG
jgi:bifunctional DNase/RNase